MISKTILASICLTTLIHAENEPNKKWQSLFNGKNLAGWKIQPTLKKHEHDVWIVDNGTILAKTPDASHNFSWLVSDKEYANFELKLKVQSYSIGKGNSGIQVRSRFEQSSGIVDGPQVDIHPKAPWRTGFLWDQTRDVSSWLSPTQGPPAAAKKGHAPNNWKWRHADGEDVWNDIHIICNHTQITTIVNGVTVVTFNGEGILNDQHHQKLKVGMNGHIMLQLHKKQSMHLRFKDIFIKQL